MFSHSYQNYISDLSADKIYHVLKNKIWDTPEQKNTSRNTNNNDAIAVDITKIRQGENTDGIDAFADISFQCSVKKVLDIGGGKFDINKNFLREKKNIELLVWDPYNRSQEHNASVQQEIQQKKADAVTSMSVLNVIFECAARLAHIATVKYALKKNGKAYFKIWAGEGSYKSTNMPCLTNNGYQSNSPTFRFLHEIELVFGKGNVEVSQQIPNLIVATNAFFAMPSLTDIQKYQTKITRKISKSNHISANLINNFSIFKKMQENFLENRHLCPKLQNQYDKQFGLVLYK